MPRATLERVAANPRGYVLCFFAPGNGHCVTPHAVLGNRILIYDNNRHEPATLSFSNLIEAHVLRSLRTEHGVPMGAVRQALAYAQREMNIDQLLLREELCTAGGQLFLDRYGELVSLSASGHLAMRKVFEAHLKRVEWGKLRFPVRLYPFLSEGTDAKSIVIDPQISFGRPVVSSAFISTRSIADRIDARESVEDVARDYGITREAVEEAIVYERAA